MYKSRILSVANMYFYAIWENKILPKISESTVGHSVGLCVMWLIVLLTNRQIQCLTENGLTIIEKNLHHIILHYIYPVLIQIQHPLMTNTLWKYSLIKFTVNDDQKRVLEIQKPS